MSRSSSFDGMLESNLKRYRFFFFFFNYYY